jgi:hypothetical protein
MSRKTRIREPWQSVIVERDLSRARTVLALLDKLMQPRWEVSTWRALWRAWFETPTVREMMLQCRSHSRQRARSIAYLRILFVSYAALLLYPEVPYARDRERRPLDWERLRARLLAEVADLSAALAAWSEVPQR